MAEYRVLIPDDLPASSVQMLEAAGFDVVFDPSMSAERLQQEIASADGIIVRSRVKVTADLLARAARLKAIVRSGAGVDNIDVETARKRGITVMNVPGANAISVAELVFAMALALLRNIVAATVSMREGRWEKKALKGRELYGKVMGIVGYGRIGRHVAEIARGFGMRVLAADPYLDEIPDAGVRKVELDHLLAKADVISIHVPLSEETHHLIGPEELAKCKPEAILINCSRGGVVDEAALEEAMRQQRLAGAGLDVYETEPPGKRSLFDLPNVVATPHIGASTVEAQERTANQAAVQLIDFLLEGKATNVVS